MSRSLLLWGYGSHAYMSCGSAFSSEDDRWYLLPSFGVSLMNKKLCAVCGGFLYLKTSAPVWVGSGSKKRVGAIRCTQECFSCDVEVTRTLSIDEFKDYAQVMNALNSRKLTF